MDEAERDLAWFAREAVAAGYVSEAQAAVLVGSDGDAARDVIRAAIWDFETDPAFTEVVARAAERSAVFNSLLTDEQRAVLYGSDGEARRRLDLREILRNPAYAALPNPGAPDWSIDWPPGTPADEVGPRRLFVPATTRLKDQAP